MSKKSKKCLKIRFKIREHTLQRIPYMVVVGDREVEQEQIAVRSLGGKDLGTVAVEEFVHMVQQ